MDAAAPYIPMDRRQALAAGRELPPTAAGAAIFADISGFTPLTEALARELGPQRGAEELTRQLNLIYSRLIDEVDRYRGSVIGFAGDAITCWFDADDGRRAVACALAMQQVVRQIGALTTPASRAVTLAIKVGVAAGPARRFEAGDPLVQRIDVLAGATVFRMAEAEQQAEKGEIVAGAEVVANLGDLLTVREWRQARDGGPRFAVVAGLNGPVAADPWAPIAPGILTEEQVRPWLLAPVYRRLLAGQGQFLAELRPAVALFLRFAGLDYDADETVAHKLDAFVRWVQQVVNRYDGALLKLAMGDKGSYLHAAFGAPVAHDDDASRAVAAALELRALPTELAYITTVQIGISQGRMRVGAYGSPSAHTYDMMGDHANLAARLMSGAAPGQIMISPAIADVVAQLYELEFIGPLSVKGKSRPVPVSLVQGRKATSPQRSAGFFAGPLVGRDAEIGQIMQVVAAVAAGTGRILRLEGPTGVGKSHLAAALTDRAAAQGFQVAVGACQSTTEHTAYAPWRQVLNALLDPPAGPGAGPQETPARRVAHLEQMVGGIDPTLLLRLPLLGDLLELPIPDNATTAAFEPRLRQRALVELIVELLRAWAQARPLLLLLDDVHWLDEASQGLAVALARALAPARVLLVVTHRPPPPGQAILPELPDSPLHTRLNLAELSPAAVAGLIANRLGGPADSLLTALIQSETQGNPFFVEEMLDALRESARIAPGADGRWTLAAPMLEALRHANSLVRQDGGWVLAPTTPLPALQLGLPDSIQGAVLSRLDRLPEAAKLTLKVASVIGRIFGLALLARSHPLQPPAAALGEQIAVMEERDFARLEVPPPDTAYMFKHNITRDVAYETLLFDQRRQLHQAISRALAALAPAAIDQLAYHSYLGEDWEQALAYLMEAGSRAQKLFANHEAIDHFEKALRCAEKLPADTTPAQRQLIHGNLGRLLTATGQYEPALAHLHTARTLAEQQGDREAQARACRWIARLYENRAEYAAALDWIRQGLTVLGDQQSPARAEMLAIAGLISMRQGNYEQAIAQGEEAMQVAERLGDKGALAFACNSRAVISVIQANNREAVHYFEKTRALYEETENIYGQAMAENGLANAYFNFGDWGRATAYYRHAGRVFNQTGDIYTLAFVQNNLGGIALNQGRLDDALADYQRSLQILEQIGGSPYVRGALHMNLGATFVRRGEIAEARAHLELSRAFYAQADARDFLPELHRHFAAAALRGADYDRAVDHANQALALARELAMRVEEATSLHLLGEIALARDDAAGAGSYLTQALPILEDADQEYELARCRITAARLYLATGNPAAAQALWAAAVATFRKLDARLDLQAAAALFPAATVASPSLLPQQQG
ncbi:MAG TPA: tetratricopeptide repeat protein [Chloroflexia bacterium]